MGFWIPATSLLFSNLNSFKHLKQFLNFSKISKFKKKSKTLKDFTIFQKNLKIFNFGFGFGAEGTEKWEVLKIFEKNWVK